MRLWIGSEDAPSDVVIAECFKELNEIVLKDIENSIETITTDNLMIYKSLLDWQARRGYNYRIIYVF